MTKRRHGRRDGRAADFDSFAHAVDPRGGMLASQVSEALSLAMATLDDPRLEDATLRDVVAEGAALRATVECPPEQIQAVTAALERAMPRLKFELASDIHRKRVPNVRFVVLPRGAA